MYVDTRDAIIITFMNETKKGGKTSNQKCLEF